MIEQEPPAQPVDPMSVREPSRRMRIDGPGWLAALLSIAGIVFLFFGSVTIVPWIADERERMTVRSIWMALSRNLPDLGPDSLVRAGFWILVVCTATLAVGLMMLVSQVRDEPGAGGD